MIDRRRVMAPTGPDTNGHEYVDLGLPSGTLWATMNVGATSPAGYGDYYQYGKGSRTYDQTSGKSDYKGTEDPLSMSVDTARQTWGGQWHMPTSAQCQELIDECTWTWGSNSGTTGYTVSKNGKSIFLPAAGYWYEDSQGNTVIYGYYWSSTPNSIYSATCLIFRNNGYKSVSSYMYRNYGTPVRPVIG